MRYLSLFSGVGGFELAIQSVFPDAVCVGYSEVDQYAIKTYQKHFPEHVNLGDITKIDIDKLPDFDMIVGGFPCQDLSVAKQNRKGLEGKRSGLFWEMIRIIEAKKPKYFLIENVASMKAKEKGVISRELATATGYSTCLLSPYVEPAMVDAKWVSAQRRKRYFWCNWDVRRPENRKIMLDDILESGKPYKSAGISTDKAYCIDANYRKSENLKHQENHHRRQLVIEKCHPITASYMNAVPEDKSQRTMVVDTVKIMQRSRGYNKGGNVSKDGKLPTLTSNSYEQNNLLQIGEYIRKLTPLECERAQCFPEGWTIGVSSTQRYRQMGNAVNVEVVKHILNELKNQTEVVKL